MKMQIYGYGGSGCTALRRSLGLSGNHPKKHSRKPIVSGYKAGYIYGDPRNAILSFMRRNENTPGGHWVITHGISLGVRVKPSLTLDKYLEQPDVFKLEDHFDNWTNHTYNGNMLFIHYETMCDHLDEISEFFGRPHLSLPHHKRISDFNTYPTKVKDRLTIMFSTLLEKIKAMPDLLIA